MEANRRVPTNQAASTTMMAALIATVIRAPIQSYKRPLDHCAHADGHVDRHQDTER